MGTTIKNIIKKTPLIDPNVAEKLLELDGHIILSKADYDHRYNILDLHHKIHPATIKTKDNKTESHDKEWAFGHIIIHDNNVYFSERPTSNRDVEEHEISSVIYANLKTYGIFDIDRNARLINEDNVDFVVDEILRLEKIGLIP